MVMTSAPGMNSRSGRQTSTINKRGNEYGKILKLGKDRGLGSNVLRVEICSL